MLGLALPEQVFAFLLVFARLGTLIMLLPALGESAVPPRVRLSLALVISFIMVALVGGALPAMPNTPFTLFFLLFGEILIGLMIGGSIRLMMSALHVAGTIIAYNSGLAAAQAFDPAQGMQSAIFSTFLTLLGTLFIFATDLHLLMIAAMHDSYDVFPPGRVPEARDFATMAIQTVANSFRLGVQMGAPFIVFGLVFNIGLGMVARLMPQLQVFFIAMPLNIILGFVILMFVIGAMMAWFVRHVEDVIAIFMV
ncbi:MAG: flagellar biosynthetic protein FliR [Sphingomonadales bacterium]